jgi:hypothetical protein
MTDFTVIPARAHHCGQMVRLLRHEHGAAVTRIGLDPHRELRGRFDISAFRRAWLIDGRLAGLGGVTGGSLSSTGYLWLAFSRIATKYPLAMVKEARRQIAEILVTKRDVITTILDGDDASKRFAVFLGFVPLDMENTNPAASRYGRRQVLARCNASDEARVKLGNGFATAMAYQREAA